MQKSQSYLTTVCLIYNEAIAFDYLVECQLTDSSA